MVNTKASFKGGVGKTTTAINLAHLLHQKDPTMLVDTDPNKSAMNWARRRQQKGQESPFNVGPATTLAKVSRDYNHFVVDTPARPENLDLESLLDGSDVLLIPTQPASMALDTLQEAYEAFQKIASPAIWVLLTSVPPAPQRDAREAREVLTDLGFRVLDAQIRRSKAFEYAARRGCLVSQITGDPLAGLAMRDYDAALEEIESIISANSGAKQEENTDVAVS